MMIYLFLRHAINPCDIPFIFMCCICNTMKLLTVTESQKPEKKLVATFSQCKGESKCKPSERLNIHFGSSGSKTYINGADDKARDNYIARHKPNEDWSRVNAGSLSRYILWSAKTLKAGIANFKKHLSC
jgi:hypothetical protein